MQTSAKNRVLWASLSVVAGGVLWGVYWIPLRHVQAAGLDGAWPSLFLYLGLLPLLAAVFIGRGLFFAVTSRALPSRSFAHWVRVFWCGVFMGTAFTFYSVSLFYTDVIRSILLFYMTPVWSTILGLLYLGEKLTLQRLLALILGGMGLMIILGIGLHWPLPENKGDWLSLIAGILWAYGSYRMFQFTEATVLEQSTGVVIGGLLSTIVLLVISGLYFAPFQGGVPVGWADVMAALPALLWLIAFVVPILFLTFWPVTIVSPARLGILLMSEVLVGVVSAALFSGEPFGWRETLGAVFLVSAGIVEVLPWRSKP